MRKFNMAQMACMVALPLAFLFAGCSGGGVARTANVQVSADDINRSQVFRAGLFLDNIEKLPPDRRQAAANAPKAAEALSAAYQIDPATKKRIDDLGLTVQAPPARRHPGQP